MDPQTIQTYDELAKDYDEETTDFWERFPPSTIEAFANAVAHGTVLDVGSGPGRDGLMLLEKGLQVTCVDASRSMVELSTARGLHSIQGDLLALPFEDESFDGVWAYTSLLHVSKDDFPNALNEIRRVLKPGGIFGLGMIEGEGEIYKESAGVGKPRLFTFYTQGELEQLLSRHGFEIFFFESIQPRSSRYLHFVSKKINA